MYIFFFQFTILMLMLRSEPNAGLSVLLTNTNLEMGADGERIGRKFGKGIYLDARMVSVIFSSLKTLL